MKSFNFLGKMLNSEEMKAITGGNDGKVDGCVERWGICTATALCCEGLTCTTTDATNRCGIGG